MRAANRRRDIGLHRGVGTDVAGWRIAYSTFLGMTAIALFCAAANADPRQTVTNSAASQTAATAPPALQGAAAILQGDLRATDDARLNVAALGPDKNTINPFAGIREEIKVFGAASGSLSPKEAARGWLALTDDYFKFVDSGGPQTTVPPQFTGAQQTPPTFHDILLVLPPPTAWAPLAAAVDARPLPKLKVGAKSGAATSLSRIALTKSLRQIALRLTAHTLASVRGGMARFRRSAARLDAAESAEEDWYGR